MSGSWTVEGWRKHRGNISRSQWYNQKRLGLMPRTYHVAGREYVSAEADAEWLAARQAEEATRIPPPTERHIAAGRKSAAVRAAQEQRG